MLNNHIKYTLANNGLWAEVCDGLEIAETTGECLELKFRLLRIAY